MTQPQNDTQSGLRDTAAKALHDVRDKAEDAFASSKDAARRTFQGVEQNPLGIVVGGLAVGVLAGALLPRSAKEKELLAPLGRKLGETIKSATAAAREAGRQELEANGLTRDAAKDRGKDLLDGVVKALTSAGSAAAHSAKGG